jgi:catalase
MAYLSLQKDWQTLTSQDTPPHRFTPSPTSAVCSPHAMRNPVGRANYQPNSWGQDTREHPQKGFRSFAATVEGQKVRLRAESFAEHYSQARQFFVSQTVTEQTHIAMALTFELSKVETPVIRERMVSHLRNIDEGLAATVAEKLGLRQMPRRADAAVEPRNDLPSSDALSIIRNDPTASRGARSAFSSAMVAMADWSRCWKRR